VKTISAYRQNKVNKKPKRVFLITLAIAVAFIAGALVGNVTHVVQDVFAAGYAGLEYASALYQESVAREIPRLVESVRNIAEVSLNGMDPDFSFIIGP